MERAYVIRVSRPTMGMTGKVVGRAGFVIGGSSVVVEARRATVGGAERGGVLVEISFQTRQGLGFSGAGEGK